MAPIDTDGMVRRKRAKKNTKSEREIFNHEIFEIRERESNGDLTADLFIRRPGGEASATDETRIFNRSKRRERRI